MPPISFKGMMSRYTHPNAALNRDFEWYELDPDVVYEAGLEYLSRMVNKVEETPDNIRDYVAVVRGLPSGVLGYARNPRGTVPSEWLEARATALEMVRLIVTALLREEVGGPVGIRIRKSDKWKL